MKRITVYTILLLLAAIFTTAIPTVAEDRPTSAPAHDQRLSRDTPKGTIRIFTLGLMLGNKDLIDATIMPVSADDMAYLLVKPKGAQPSIKELKETCAKLTMRFLKPGDKFTLPDGSVVVTTTEDVNGTAMVAVPEGAPVPTRLYKEKGYWWVDAGAVIAGSRGQEKHAAPDTGNSKDK